MRRPRPRSRAELRVGRPPLTVERTPTGYALRDPALERLTGIEVLPLPFTPDAFPAEVLAHLRRLNPLRVVVFDGPLAPPEAARP